MPSLTFTHTHTHALTLCQYTLQHLAYEEFTGFTRRRRKKNSTKLYSPVSMTDVINNQVIISVRNVLFVCVWIYSLFPFELSLGCHTWLHRCTVTSISNRLYTHVHLTHAHSHLLYFQKPDLYSLHGSTWRDTRTLPLIVFIWTQQILTDFTVSW